MTVKSVVLGLAVFVSLPAPAFASSAQTAEIHMADAPELPTIDATCLSLDKDCAPVSVDQAAVYIPHASNGTVSAVVKPGVLGSIFGHSAHTTATTPKCSLRSVDLDALLGRIRQTFLDFSLPILKSDQSQRRAIVVTVQRPRGTGQQFYRALVRFDQGVACRVESSVYSLLQEPSKPPTLLLDDAVTIAVRTLVQNSYRH